MQALYISYLYSYMKVLQSPFWCWCFAKAGIKTTKNVSWASLVSKKPSHHRKLGSLAMGGFFFGNGFLTWIKITGRYIFPSFETRLWFKYQIRHYGLGLQKGKGWLEQMFSKFRHCLDWLDPARQSKQAINTFFNSISWCGFWSFINNCF